MVLSINNEVIDSSIYLIFKIKQDKNANIVHFVYYEITRLLLLFFGGLLSNSSNLSDCLHNYKHEWILKCSNFPRYYR